MTKKNYNITLKYYYCADILTMTTYIKPANQKTVKSDRNVPDNRILQF